MNGPASIEIPYGGRLTNLAGVDWLYVPYVKPGVSLSRAIAAGLGPSTNVIVLGNHGLIIAADTVAAAAGLVERVCSALEAAPQPVWDGNTI